MAIPSRTIGRHLAEMFEGTDPLEISAQIKGHARIFSFALRAEDEVILIAHRDRVPELDQRRRAKKS